MVVLAIESQPRAWNLCELEGQLTGACEHAGATRPGKRDVCEYRQHVGSRSRDNDLARLIPEDKQAARSIVWVSANRVSTTPTDVNDPRASRAREGYACGEIGDIWDDKDRIWDRQPSAIRIKQ
jgi:hypothetical protein